MVLHTIVDLNEIFSSLDYIEELKYNKSVNKIMFSTNPYNFLKLNNYLN